MSTGTFNRPATLADVGRLAGVSRSVAGRVMNGGGGNTRFGEKAEQRVRQAAEELGYRPNPAARTLCGKRSHTFGQLVASAGDPLRSFLVQYLDSEAVKIGCHTLIGNTVGRADVGPDQFEYHVDQFARRGVDGVFCAVRAWCEGNRAALLARHPNTVFYEDPGVPGAAYVTIDRREAVRLAVRHLIERGRRRIGLALMTLSRPTHLARLRGYEIELTAHGLPVDRELVFNGEPHGLAYACCNIETDRWDFPLEIADRVIDRLVDDQRADAIVAHDDFWAATLLRRIHARGMRVPDDVAVVGYLNHYLADWTDPPLTTVDLRHQKAARCMVEMLERIVNHGPLPEDQRVVKIQPKLIVRESA